MHYRPEESPYEPGTRVPLQHSNSVLDGPSAGMQDPHPHSSYRAHTHPGSEMQWVRLRTHYRNYGRFRSCCIDLRRWHVDVAVMLPAIDPE